MKKGIIGKKIGMTQIFDEKGNVIPVTVIAAGPCTVTQKETSALRKCPFAGLVSFLSAISS